MNMKRVLKRAFFWNNALLEAEKGYLVVENHLIKR